MLRNLREVDEVTVEAVGPRFDLEKVLSDALPIVRSILNRAAIRDPFVPVAYCASGDGWEPFDECMYDAIASGFRGVFREGLVADEFFYAIHRSPLYLALALLGYEALYRVSGAHMTSMGESWEHLDLTPKIVIAPCRPDDWIRQRDVKFLSSTLAAMGSEADACCISDGYGRVTQYVIAFPHAAYGAGEGPLRLSVFKDEEGSP